MADLGDVLLLMTSSASRWARLQLAVTDWHDPGLIDTLISEAESEGTYHSLGDDSHDNRPRTNHVNVWADQTGVVRTDWAELNLTCIVNGDWTRSIPPLGEVVSDERHLYSVSELLDALPIASAFDIELAQDGSVGGRPTHTLKGKKKLSGHHNRHLHALLGERIEISIDQYLGIATKIRSIARNRTVADQEVTHVVVDPA